MNQLIDLIKKFYGEIYSKKGDKYGIPLLDRDGVTLYISKKFSEVLFVNMKNGEVKSVENNAYNTDVLIAIGMLNEAIDDVGRKQLFFNQIMAIMKSNMREKSA